MYLKKILRLPGTLAFRLTLWYAGIFTISTLVAFLALYFVISTVLKERRDQDLVDDVTRVFLHARHRRDGQGQI